MYIAERSELKNLTHLYREKRDIFNCVGDQRVWSVPSLRPLVSANTNYIICDKLFVLSPLKPEISDEVSIVFNEYKSVCI